MKVTKDTLVEMHYRLYDAEETLVESTEDEGPVRYQHGQDEILPGLESALEGAEAGGHVRVTVEPEEAYGAYNPEGLVVVPRDQLPEDQEYATGDWLSVTLEDDGEGDLDEGGAVPGEESEMEMRIVEVREAEVVLDANHPLAGQRVTFDIDVLTVEPAGS